jgi:hypothetical protein
VLTYHDPRAAEGRPLEFSDLQSKRGVARRNEGKAENTENTYAYDDDDDDFYLRPPRAIESEQWSI